MSDEIPSNPFIAQPDPFEPMRESINSLMEKNPELQEDARLCYETFVINKHGEQLMKSFVKRYCEDEQLDPTQDNAANTALFWSGFRRCLWTFRMLANEHKQRIEARF